MPVIRGRFAHFLRRLGASLGRLHRPISEPWLRRASIDELRRLSARELRDVGIEPYEIDALVDDMLAARRRGV